MLYYIKHTYIIRTWVCIISGCITLSLLYMFYLLGCFVRGATSELYGKVYGMLHHVQCNATPDNRVLTYDTRTMYVLHV